MGIVSVDGIADLVEIVVRDQVELFRSQNQCALVAWEALDGPARQSSTVTWHDVANLIEDIYRENNGLPSRRTWLNRGEVEGDG